MLITLIGIQQHYQIQKVAEALHDLGADAMVVDVTAPKQIEIGTCAEGIFCRYDGHDLCDSRVIWQCLKLSLSPFGQSEEWLANYINGTQWSSVLYNLMMALRRQIKVINDPVATMVSSYKLDQLQTAQRLGMAVPASLISNSLGAIGKAFDADIPLITKALGNPQIPQIRDGVVSQTAITTSRVDRGLLQGAEFDLDPHPSFVQAEVGKRYEIRTVAVGEHFFPARLTATSTRLWSLITVWGWQWSITSLWLRLMLFALLRPLIWRITV